MKGTMMKKLIVLGFGAVALAATPAAAQPAHAKGKAKAHAPYAQTYQATDSRRVPDRYRTDPYVGSRYAASHYGYNQRAGHCPPGLKKKNPQCMPPGQYKKQFNVGHRFPSNYDRWTPYNQIPYDIRRQYGLDPRGRYIYDNNYVYRVDPTTMVVSEVLRAIL